MYMTFNIAAPIIGDWVSDQRFKNIFMRNFPTKVVNGHVVFGEVSLRYPSIDASPANIKAIYKLLSISNDTLLQYRQEGVDDAHLYLKPYNMGNPTLTTQNVIDYINDNSVKREYTLVDVGLPTERLVHTNKELSDVYVDVAFTTSIDRLGDSVSPTITSAQVEALVLSGASAISETYMKIGGGGYTSTSIPFSFLNGQIEYDVNPSKVTFAAIHDNENSIFSRKADVISKSIVSTTAKRIIGEGDSSLIVTYPVYNIIGAVRFTFAREIDAGDPAGAAVIQELLDQLNLVPKEVHIVNTYNNDTPLTLRYLADRTVKSSMARQMDDCRRVIQPVIDSDLITGGCIRKDAAELLTGKQFVTMVNGALDVDVKYHRKKRHGFYTFLLTIAVVVVAVVLAVPSGGGSLGFIPTIVVGLGVSAELVFLVGVAIVLTLETLVLSLVAIAYQRSGHTYLAMMIGEALVVINMAQQVIGVLIMAIGIGQLISKLSELAVAEATATVVASLDAAGTEYVGTITGEILVNGVEQAIKPTISNYVSAAIEMVMPNFGGFTNMGTKELLMKSIKYLTTAGNLYLEYIAPHTDPGTMPDPVDAVSTETIELTQVYLDDNYCYELNTVMELAPYNMTEGVLVSAFNKYYKNG